MSLITEFYGPAILKIRKDIVIELIRDSAVIPPEQRAAALRDWGVATGTELSAADYEAVGGVQE